MRHAVRGATLLTLALAVPCFAAPPAEAAFPGNNGLIAFAKSTSTVGGVNSEIFTMTPDGMLQLNRSNNAAHDSDPGFSADGSKIAFVSRRDGNDEIYVMNADGTGQSRLTSNAAADTAPAFSRDGKRIVFVSARDGNSELYAIDAANGGNLARLTTTAASESEPVFSPDGSRIAFVSRGDIGGLSVMNADGTGVTTLTSSQADSSPDFSPDGSKVVFSSTAVNDRDIFTINADGGGPRTNLTEDNNGATHYYKPAFSPDGTQIAFAGFTSYIGTGWQNEIFTMNADGSEQTNRSLLVGADDSPSWGPKPASADKDLPL